MDQIYNIMTSCDYKMYTHVSIMLCSIAETLASDTINFYILCTEESLRDFDLLEKVETHYINLNLIVIPVYDSNAYKRYADYGGTWPVEAYFTMCCQRYLPEDLDRILYLDAGDMMVVDDIKEFYFQNFDGKTILAAAPLRYKSNCNNIELFTRQNIETPEELDSILKGQFNSGSYMINLQKMRESNRSLEDYDYIIDPLINLYAELYPTQIDKLYWGDQGILGFMYLGDVKMFHSDIKILKMEYNFHLKIYSENYTPNFPSVPHILHFCGVPKPWQIDYDSERLDQIMDRGNIPLESISPYIIDYYKKWYDYAAVVASL